MSVNRRKFTRWMKIIASIFAILILGVLLSLWWIHEPKPEGKSGTEADQLAREMLKAVNKPAWDSTKYVQFTFKGIHEFLWDKNRHFTRVRWKNNEVLLDINKRKGFAYQDGQELTGTEADQLVINAWKMWVNDSFWLNAPVKAFDPGTQRYIVDLEDGQKGLMVSYNSGGVTPGDSYLWILDADNRPIKWKMWVKIIPVGGLEFSWENWVNLSTGAEIATMHRNPLLDLDIANLKGGNELSLFGETEDPFVKLSSI